MIEWISVKDRLPPNDNAVLVFYKFKYIEVGWVNRSQLGSLWQVCGHDVGNDWVTHWMPLPNPPQEFIK